MRAGNLRKRSCVRKKNRERIPRLRNGSRFSTLEDPFAGNEPAYEAHHPDLDELAHDWAKVQLAYEKPEDKVASEREHHCGDRVRKHLSPERAGTAVIKDPILL